MKKTIWIICFLLVETLLFAQRCPKLTAKYFNEPVSYGGALAVEGNLLYIHSIPHSGMFAIFDLSTPNNPILVSEFIGQSCKPKISTIVKDKTIYYDELCFCPAWPGSPCRDGFVAWDTTRPNRPRKLFGYMSESGVLNSAIDDDLALLSVLFFGLEILQLEANNPPSTLSFLDIPCTINSEDRMIPIIEKDIAYISCNDGLILITVDYHDPLNPVLLSEQMLPERISDGNMVIKDNYLFILNESFDVVIYEIEENHSITEINRWNDGNDFKELILNGDLLIARYYDASIDNYGIRILNISDPLNVEEVGDWHPHANEDWKLAALATDWTKVVARIYSRYPNPNSGFYVFDTSGCLPRPILEPFTAVEVPK